MQTLPVPSLRTSLLLLRVVTPLLFMAHAVVRIFNGSIPQFAGFMGQLGFPEPTLVVWIITLSELIAGALIVFGFWVRPAVAVLASIALGGIGLIHYKIGWFVGEHGTGGSEYSVCLLMCLLVLAAADAERRPA